MTRASGNHLSAAILAAAAALTAATATAADNAEPIILKLWPNEAPGETEAVGPEVELPPRGEKKVVRLTNVSDPEIHVFPAPAEKANGCGVVICPGGGYQILAWDLEGTEVAEWFNSIGVTAVVLKYRVPRRSSDAPHQAPLQDAQRAIRLVRQQAAKWDIDPRRIGLLGFSAGGHLAAMAGMHFDRSTYERVDAADDLSCRPDFIMPIYAAYLGDKKDDTQLSSLVRVTKQTPPTFLAVTLDDKMRGVHAALLLVELKQAGVPCELHVYSQGGHGYGLRPSSNPVSTWHKRCEQWLRVSGWLDKRSRP